MGLLEITKLATADNAVIHLNTADNVAIARVALSRGQELRVAERVLKVRDAIPAGHKVAIAAIEAGENVLRYGQVIGRARARIEPGQHVHIHNLSFEELAFAYEFPEEELRGGKVAERVPTFMGYAREDGRVGTRNYIAVVAASNCAAHTAELIAASFEDERLPPNVDGVAAFPHGEGCGHSIGPDTEQLQRTLAGVLDHPNVSAAIILGLGCEVNQIDHYLGAGTLRSDRLVGMTLQSSGGTRATVEAARKTIRALMERASAEKRAETPASKIVLGLNCGGSDSFSGITANPALGVCCDTLAEIGGTAVLAETTEIFGAEHLLVRRARNRQIAEKLLACIAGYKKYLSRFGGSFDDNPTPGNKEGGLTNILEKSLGAAAKAGTSPLMDVVDYAERIHSPGFVFMNTPGYDPVSLTGLAAGGVNLIAFTTGRGSAIGFPTIPVIKIASNSATYRRMRDNMDVNAGRIADGDATVGEIGREIFDLVLRVASGEKTASERLGHQEFVPWRIGPV
ncbi:MAG TPA: altronate dehydratase family protein, partial [Candidatus Binataceae bacterium]|nr:altronate dehydratase family protein [Candidatus Binataceae bacterium]